ncbi:MAG: PEP-CTERM sorting domain-containing protein [Planctomycetota bacterium]|nr:MAG: PEP-CTERM sorting domain-containing protein [Planctomycetota bacterium]
MSTASQIISKFTGRSLNKVLSIWGVAIVATMLVGQAASAAPVVLYDSITANTADGSNTADVTNWLANEFKTDAETYDLTSVVLKLASTPLGTIEVDLYSNNPVGNVPGSVIGGFSNPGSLAAGDLTFTPATSQQLLPNTSYWVVLKNSGTWNYTNGSATGPGASQRWADGSNSGAIWSASTGGPYLMTVNATPVAVPEPSTWAMGLAGVAFAGVKVLRRRRRIQVQG